MIIIHNFLLRGINSIYNQCIKVMQSPADIPDFVDYALVWEKAVDEHHTAEEQLLFPEIERAAGVPGLMHVSVEQHKTFHDGLEKYKKYLMSVKEKAEPFDAQKLKSIIDSFMPVLRGHLASEIETLLGLSLYENKTDWDRWFAEVQKKIIKSPGAEGHIVRYPSANLVSQLHQSTYCSGQPFRFCFLE